MSRLWKSLRTLLLIARETLQPRVVVLAALMAVAFLNVAPSWRAADPVALAATAKWANCPGFSFQARQEGDWHTTFGVQKRGSALMFCGIQLPQGATVTAVKFHLFDDSSTWNITDCFLSRAKLDPPTGVFQRLAGPLSTSGTPKYVTLTDTSIQNATVNNRYYAYFAECFMYPGDQATNAPTGIVGMSVRYNP